MLQIGSPVTTTGIGGPALCAMFGHSFAARAHYSFANGTMGRNTGKMAYGPAAWIEAYSGGRLLCPNEMNFGVNGETTTQMLAHVDADVAKAVAAGVEVVFLFVLNNDVMATPAQVATTIDNIRTLTKKWTDPGIAAVITGDFPAGTAANTVNRRVGAQRNGFNQIRRWCLEVLPRLYPGIIAFDIFDRLAVWNSSNGDVIQSYFDPDALHPWSQFYSEVYAPAIIPTLLALYPSVLAVAEASASEPYDATMNPRGNLATNGMLDGDNSGMANGWNRSDAAGITCTPSKVALAAGNGMWQQLSYSGTAATAGAVSDFRQNIPLGAAGVLAGDLLQGVGLIEIDAGAVNLRGVTLRAVLFDNVGGSNTYEALSMSWNTQGDRMATRGFTGANAQFHRAIGERLPAGALASGASGFFGVRIVWDAPGASSAVIRTRKLRLHKVMA